MDKRPLQLLDYWALKIVDEMDLSPDGSTAAYVVTSFDEVRNTIHKTIWLADLNTRETRQLTSGDAQDTNPAWSSDGSRLAFVSTRHDGTPQVHVVPLHGGEARRVTDLPDGTLKPVWSPDGKRLCVMSPVKSGRQDVADEKAWFEDHEKANSAAPRMRRMATIPFRFDARGYIDRRFHLYIVDLENPGTEPFALTSGDFDHTEAAWSPDGELIAYVSNRREDAAGIFSSDICTVRPNGEDKRCMTDGTLSATSPAWSPDGETVAFYAHPTKEFAGRQHVWVVSRGGSGARDVSGRLDRTRIFMHSEYGASAPTPPAWSPDGEAVYALFGDGSDGAVFRVDVDSGETKRISTDAGDVSMVQCKGTGELVVGIASTPATPLDLVTINAGGGPFSWVTRTNATLLSEAAIVPAEKLRFKGAQGWDIEGWYIPPVDHTPGTPAPLILEIHGGPQAAWPFGFAFHTQAYAGAGYGSLYINPRGSLGWGYDFMKACDWGLTDFHDHMAGVDLLIERGDADPKRLGVTGISYGGFMTNWIAGHTDRFAAAVSVNSVSNLFSLFGTSDICGPWFMGEMDGPFWTSAEQFEKYRLHSPISYVGNVTTPMLFLQAEADWRCPIEQGEQMLTALRIQDKPAELVRIPGASHAIPDSPLPHQRYLHWKLELDWFDKYVTGTEAQEAEPESSAVPVSVPQFQ